MSKKLSVTFSWNEYTVIAKAKDIDEYAEPFELTLQILDDNSVLLDDTNMTFDADTMFDIESTACDMLYDKKYHSDVYESLYE